MHWTDNIVVLFGMIDLKSVWGSDTDPSDYGLLMLKLNEELELADSSRYVGISIMHA